VSIQFIPSTETAPDVSALVSASPFKNTPLGNLGNGLGAGVVAEYRAVYKQCAWKPEYSVFGLSVRPGPHDGVDLYAPRGTEVVAVTAGNAYYHQNSGEFGNSVTLVFKVGTKPHYFLYGHLEDFTAAELANDGEPATKGKVLGRVGCSGNAGYNCATSEHCPFANEPLSSHLHLSLVRDDRLAAKNPAFDVAAGTKWIFKMP